MIASGRALGIAEMGGTLQLAVVRATRKPTVLKSVTVAMEGSRLDSLHAGLQQIAPVPAQFTYVALGERETFRKLVELPAGVREKEIAAVVRSEVAGFLPTDISAMELEFQVLPHPSGVRFVVVTAVETAAVSALLQDLSAVRLTVRAIDTLPSCIVRAFDVPTKQWHSKRLLEHAETDGIPLTAFVYVPVVGEVLAGVAMGPTVIAVSQIRVGQEVILLAAAVAEELQHLAKFVANRLDVATPLQRLVLSGDGDQAQVAALAEAIVAEKIVPEVSFGSWVDGATTAPSIAVGAGLYPLFGGGTI